MLIRNQSVLIGFLENQSESVIPNSFSKKDFQEYSIGDQRSRRLITNGPFVGAVYDRAFFRSLTTARGHRPRLQWYQSHCYALLVDTSRNFKELAQSVLPSEKDEIYRDTQQNQCRAHECSPGIGHKRIDDYTEVRKSKSDRHERISRRLK